uniref:Uncharacterized protein n=1 Tax=Magallana gigas TaxID=29159 RepID=K1P972_MAGGI
MSWISVPLSDRCSGINTIDDTQLNSRTINLVLETDPYTCLLHRQVREVERSYIQTTLQKAAQFHSRYM